MRDVTFSLTHVTLQLAPGKWQRHPCAERLLVHSLQQALQPSFVGRRKDDDARAFGGRELAIVEIIPIERDERATELPRQAEMLDVSRAPHHVIFEHEKHVPPESFTHICHNAGRNVGVGIDARLIGRALDERREFR